MTREWVPQTQHASRTGTPAQKAKVSSSDRTAQMQSMVQRGHRKIRVSMIHTPPHQLGAANFVALPILGLRASVRGPTWLGFASPVLMEHDVAALRLDSDAMAAT
jgi:hypothetical protein